MNRDYRSADERQHNFFILRIHSKQIDEHFIVFNNTYPKALYTDRIKLENDYGKLWDYQVTVTRKELNFRLKQLPDSILETINQHYV